MRLSIYNLLKPSTSSGKIALQDFIMDSYMDLPIERKTLKKHHITDYQKAMMFYQEITQEPPEWLMKINSLLNVPFESDNYTQNKVRAVIILLVNRRYFALSFNSGIAMVKSEYINYDFGFEVARKLVDDVKISGYYSTDISERIINTNRNSAHFIPTHVINDRRNLSAVNSISGTGSGEIKTKITGKYNLVVNFNKDLKTNLIPYLKQISNIYFSDSHSSIPISTGLNEIKDPNEIDFLNRSLVKDIMEWSEYLFKNKELPSKFFAKPISFNINHQILENNLLNYSITGLGSNYIYSAEELNTQNFFNRFCYYINDKDKATDEKYILDKLKRDNIYLISDDDQRKLDVVYNSLIVRYPLSQEDSDKEAILISGKWFSLSKNYYIELEDIIEEFKDHYQKVKLPGYSKNDKNEYAYNKRIAKSNKFKLLDETWYRYPETLKSNNFNSYSKIEPCDLLNYEESEDLTERSLVLFHIKRGGSAQGISHLTTQAETSANLLSDDYAKIDFIKFMNSQRPNDDMDNMPDIGDMPNIPTDIKPEEITIVLGITQKNHRGSLRNTLTLLELNALSRSLMDIRSKGFNVSLNILPDNT